MRRQEGRGEWTRRASAWPRLAKKIRAICDGRMAATAGREAHISSLATLHVVCGGAVQDCDAPFAYPSASRCASGEKTYVLGRTYDV